MQCFQENVNRDYNYNTTPMLYNYYNDNSEAALNFRIKP